MSWCFAQHIHGRVTVFLPSFRKQDNHFNRFAGWQIGMCDFNLSSGENRCFNMNLIGHSADPTGYFRKELNDVLVMVPNICGKCMLRAVGWAPPIFYYFAGFRPRATRPFCFGKRAENHSRPCAALRVPSLPHQITWLRNSLRSNSARRSGRFGAAAPPRPRRVKRGSSTKRAPHPKA